MLINIMVATVASNPAVALKPRGHLFSVRFRLRHGHCFVNKYMRNQKFSSIINTQLFAQYSCA